MGVAIRRPILEFIEEVQVVADGGLRAELSESEGIDDGGEGTDTESIEENILTSVGTMYVQQG